MEPGPAQRMLRDLCAGFEMCRAESGAQPFPEVVADVVDADDLPVSYREMLAHDRHMTATLRNWFQDELRLRVVATRSDGSWYRRMIELILARTGAVVEIGVVRLDTSALAPSARAAVFERRQPLGDILVGSGVLTRVQVAWYLRFGVRAALVRSLAGRSDAPVYGRLATIQCDGHAALELLEVVTDDPTISESGEPAASR